MLAAINRQIATLLAAEDARLVIAVEDMERGLAASYGYRSVSGVVERLLLLTEQQEQVALILTGHLTPSELTAVRDRLPGEYEELQVERFNRFEGQEYLTEALAAANLFIALDGTNLIYDLTAGYPYLVWLAGDALVEAYNAANGNQEEFAPVFTRSAAEFALRQPRFYRRARNYVYQPLLEYAERIGPPGPRILAYIARSTQPVAVNEIIDYYKLTQLQAIDNVKQAYLDLQASGLLTRRASGATVSITLLRDYVRSIIPG